MERTEDGRAKLQLLDDNNNKIGYTLSNKLAQLMIRLKNKYRTNNNFFNSRS